MRRSHGGRHPRHAAPAARQGAKLRRSQGPVGFRVPLKGTIRVPLRDLYGFRVYGLGLRLGFGG